MNEPERFDLETYSGAKLNLDDFDPSLVVIEDIARALSRQCRYNGHCSRFYSVAEHCVLSSYWMKRKGAGPRLQLLGLMHDSAEAYLGDIISPVKQRLERFREMEERATLAIWIAFGIRPPSPDECKMVKQGDLVMLATEAQCLMKSKGVGWNISERPDAKVLFRWLGPDQAMAMFLARFNHLAQPAQLPAQPGAITPARPDLEEPSDWEEPDVGADE